MIRGELNHNCFGGIAHTFRAHAIRHAIVLSSGAFVFLYLRYEDGIYIC